MSGWNEQGQRFSSRVNPNTPKFPTPPNDSTRFREPQYQDPRSSYVDGSSNSPHDSANSNSARNDRLATQMAGAPDRFVQQMAGASVFSQHTETPPNSSHTPFLHDVELQTPQITHPPYQTSYFQQPTPLSQTEIPLGNQSISSNPLQTYLPAQHYSHPYQQVHQHESPYQTHPQTQNNVLVLDQLQQTINNLTQQLAATQQQLSETNSFNRQLQQKLLESAVNSSTSTVRSTQIPEQVSLQHAPSQYVTYSMASESQQQQSQPTITSTAETLLPSLPAQQPLPQRETPAAYANQQHDAQCTPSVILAEHGSITSSLSSHFTNLGHASKNTTKAPSQQQSIRHTDFQQTHYPGTQDDTSSNHSGDEMPDLINRHASLSSSSTRSDDNSIGIGQPETKEIDPEDGPNEVLSVHHITTPPNTHEELHRHICPTVKRFHSCIIFWRSALLHTS